MARRKKKVHAPKEAGEETKTFRVADVLPGKIEKVWTAGALPHYWVRPFGTLLHEKKRPHTNEFGVAFVLHKHPDNTEEKLMKFGQVVGVQGGSYRFRTPDVHNPHRKPVEYLLSPERFAPALVGDAKYHSRVPNVTWALPAIQAPHVPAATQRSEHSKHPIDLTAQLKVRFDDANRKCSRHRDATSLLEQFRERLLAQRRERRRLLDEGRSQTEVLKVNHETEISNRIMQQQLKTTQNLLSKEDRSCSAALGEVLAQEEVDECRKRIPDSALESVENRALREVIEHGTEVEARRAILSLLASYEDSAKETPWAASVQSCLAKILSPEERQGGLPEDLLRRDVDAIEKGRGFSKVSEKALLERCRKSKAVPLIRALLASKGARHDEQDWAEIKKLLEVEERDLRSFLAARNCREQVDKLLRAGTLESCRYVFLDALHSLGTQGHGLDDAKTLGRLYSLKANVARQHHKTDLGSPEINRCLTLLELPPLAHLEPGALRNNLAESCLSLSEDKVELIYYEFLGGDQDAEKKMALEKLQAMTRGQHGKEPCFQATTQMLQTLYPSP